MRENIIEQLRFCATHFSCEGCVGGCVTGSNEPRTAFVSNEAADAIEELLAEVRGVVHCGECSHADKDLPGAIYCTMWDAWEVPEDGFCYKGARMEVSEDARDA